MSVGRSVPYTEAMARLTEIERQEFAASYPQWKIEGEALRRTFTFRDFTEAMGFVTKVALLAERADHHPDIEIRWNQVTLTLSTHSEGGLTRRDTDLAARISTLAP